MDLQEIQLLAQLADNLDILSQRLEKSYQTNNLEEFNKSKSEIIIIQKKISQILQNEY